MIEIRQILCPIDFSDFSRRALDHAVGIARWYGSTVTLLHVYSVVPFTPGTPEIYPAAILGPEYREDVLAELRNFAGRDSTSPVPLRFEVREGHTASEIVAHARELPSDLIVMGTHGRSGFERFVLGSVAERVLRTASCPVLTVPPGTAETVPMPPLFKRILCAIDFSDCSMHALTYASSLAQEADAHLTVLHVLELPPALEPGWRETLTPPSLRAHMLELEEDRRAQLSRAVPPEVCTHCTVETLMVSGAPAYREVLKVAGEQQSELIVIGIQGRGAVDLMFFGSTAQHVVREAACPVLTIRQNEKRG